MSLLLAVFLGLVQGLTEFLPVSSSGHLALFQMLFGGDVEADYMLFDVLLHFGTLLSVFIAFWDDIREMIVAFFGWVRAGFKLEGNGYRRFVALVLLTIVPMFAVLPFRSKIEAMFDSTFFVGMFLLITAALLYLSERAPRLHKTQENATFLDALVVGVAQCFATLPGLSRSGTTICAGLFRGFERDFAVKFAFIMSLPVVFGANLLEIGDAIKTPPAVPVPLYIYLAGMLTALVSGLLAIRLVRLVTKRGNFRPFVVYCAAVGAIAIITSFF